MCTLECHLFERKPCKTLFINTPHIKEMYKRIREKKRKNLKDVIGRAHR